jgi:hypothetical protein
MNSKTFAPVILLNLQEYSGVYSELIFLPVKFSYY